MKKRFLFLLLGLFILIPNAKATVTGYVTLEEINNNSSAVTETYNDEGAVLEYYLTNSTNFSLKVKGHDLAPVEEGYSMIKALIQVPNGAMNNTTSFDAINGENGFSISYTETPNSYNSYFPYFDLILRHSTDESLIKIKKGTTEYDSVRLYFVDPAIFDSFDEAYHNLTTEGKLSIDTVKPGDMFIVDAMITTALNKYNTKSYSLEGTCSNEEMTNCSITFRDNTNPRISINYGIEYIFKDEIANIASKIAVFSDNFDEYASANIGPMGVVFTIEDLENINYLYTFIQNPTSEINKINAAARFSKQIKEILEYSNISAEFYIGMGEGNFGDLVNMALGHMAISYNDTIYGAANGIGYIRINNIYIPDDTEDSRDTYISAAKNRIEEYLPDATVTITYKGLINDLSDFIKDNIDTTKTLGEYYTVSIDGNKYDFIISKDSSKMQNTSIKTIDFDTNIEVNTVNTNIPLDTKLQASILDKNSNEYRSLMQKLKINDGYAVDLKLFSDTANIYITRLDNGKFRVSIPLNDEYKNKELVAYYLNDDNSTEEFEISIDENGYAVFETSHFSTYTITTSGDINPPTGDSIITYLIIFIISGTGIILLDKRKIKNYQ